MFLAFYFGYHNGLDRGIFTPESSFLDHFREPGVGDTWTALPQFFKENGYYTTGGGKIFVRPRSARFDWNVD